MDKSGKTCPVRWCLLPAIAVFIALFACDYVFHGIIMMPSYKATAALWRPEADMQNYYYVNLIKQAVTALVATCLFGWLCCAASEAGAKCPVKMGAKFGIKIGLLIGITMFGSYFYLPIPRNMALAWLVGNVVEGLAIGLVLGFIYRMKCNKNEAGTGNA